MKNKLHYVEVTSKHDEDAETRIETFPDIKSALVYAHDRHLETRWGGFHRIDAIEDDPLVPGQIRRRCLGGHYSGIEVPSK